MKRRLTWFVLAVLVVLIAGSAWIGTDEMLKLLDGLVALWKEAV